MNNFIIYQRSHVLIIGRKTKYLIVAQSIKKIQKEFGLHIRLLRQEHGWVSWRHLQQIESGQKNVTLETIIKLAKLFKITPSELLKDL